MAIKVTSVRTGPPYKLVLEFSDATFGVYDCSAILDEPGSVSALRDRRYFGRVTLENGVPTWPNHFDISPQWLREELEGRGELNFPQPVRKRR